MVGCVVTEREISLLFNDELDNGECDVPLAVEE
jgi:hypothetical protein